MPSYLELAYNGNYVSNCRWLMGICASDIFEYNGRVYLANWEHERIVELEQTPNLFD